MQFYLESGSNENLVNPFHGNELFIKRKKEKKKTTKILVAQSTNSSAPHPPGPTYSGGM